MIIILLLSSLAFGNEGVVTLKKGDRAPFEGTLLSAEAAAKIITTSDSELQECLINAKRDLALQQTQLTYEKKNVEASLAACTLKQTEMEKLYEKQIENLEKQAVKPKWEAPTYFAAGILTGAALIYGSSIILKNIGETN